MTPAQLRLPLGLPAWEAAAPYADERDARGRPTSCPALLVDGAGRRWRYAGGLTEGAPRYEPDEQRRDG